MAQDPAQHEYRRRLELHQAAEARLGRWHRRVGNGKVAVFVVALGVAWPVLATRSWSSLWLVPPVALLVALVAVHGMVVGALHRRRLAATFYRRGLSRLNEEDHEPLHDGAEFVDDEHPYAADLDLFGPGSLYARLCTAHSLAGREALASWLSVAAEPMEILERQRAAGELAERIDLREQMAVLAADLSPRIGVVDLATWGGAARRLSGLVVPWAGVLLAAVNLVVVGAWLAGPLSGRVALPLLAGGALLVWTRRSAVRETLAALSLPAGELRFFARVLERLEREKFASPLLCELQRRATDPDARPSERLLELARLIEWNDSRGNLFFQPLAGLLLLGTQFAYAAERWRARHGVAVGEWLRAIGEFEALACLAAFTYENPDYTVPEIVQGAPRIESESLAHPLLKRAVRVANTVTLVGAGEPSAPGLLLVSGSNMSGKSTLLRTVGVAAVLALAGAVVPAKRLLLSRLAVGASIRLHDSLLEGVSRFYAELQRLRQIRDLAGAGPTLFLLDEILHGTNSHDRRLGAAGVVRGLLDDGAIGLVTTHDLALAEIVDELGPVAANVHFEDHVEDGRMGFDYRLRPGVVKRGNALALMRSLGLPVADG